MRQVRRGKPRTKLALTPRRSRVKRTLFAAFLAIERAGVHVLPRHFYSPVADRRWLRRNPGLWRAPASLPGVDWDLAAQLRWLNEVCAEHLEEVRGFPFVEDLERRGIDF